MEEAVFGAVAGAIIQPVVDKLLSIPIGEINRIWRFQKELEKLRNSFQMIRAFLDDAEKKQTDEAVSLWLKRLEAVAFNADNVFDELNYEVLREKVEAEHKLKRKFSSFLPYINSIPFHRKMAEKINDINKELESINQVAKSFGLQMRLAHAPSVGSEASTGLETDSFTVDPIFLGRENDVSKIVEMLTTGPTDQVLSILPIVGMGGLGKTALARKVYGHYEIISRFEDNRIWVHVPKNFDPVILFKNVLESSTKENVELGSREVLLQKLQKSLGEKRYLLVLDNVWNEDTEKWGSFINSLKGISSVRGNVMIVTTRSEKVASIVKTFDIHQLERLSDDNCWSIIKAKSFKEADIPSDFEATGKCIAKRCGGLPLAAKVLGALLCGKPKGEWLSIEKNWLSNFGGDGNIILKMLKLSFDNLPSPSIKKCFAYCSLGPKYFYISREKMIEVWTAEGFLQNYDERNDMETVGNKFFDILVQSSLLQVVKKHEYGSATLYGMHDLVYDLACSILGLRVNNNNLDDISQVRYIWCKSGESCAIREEQARCLRSLFSEDKVSNIRLSHFKCLRVLVLMDEEVTELPSSIKELIHLRYLEISCTRIECLPDWIGELYHLQTLRAVNDRKWKKNYLRKLPNTLKYLISLRHLHIPNIEMPPEIGRLTALQTLPYFQVGGEKGRGIVELGSLKNLKGELEIHNLEKVQDKEEAKSADLFQKPNIFRLKFVWNEPREGEANDENVLEGLQPHPNLKGLEIDGFKGRSFPLWTLKMAVREDPEGRSVGLNNLMEIRLINCKECEDIPTLGHLPHLKSLYLHGLTSVRSIGSSFYGIGKNRVREGTVIVFPALERLELVNMSNLTEWVEVQLPSASETESCEVLVFPSLEYLKITKCRQLMSAPSLFPCLKELDIFEMDTDLPLANICGVKLTSLAKLRIRGLNGVKCLPNGLFYNNQNLLELEIIDCPCLTHLVPCLGGSGTSLKKLYIQECLNLIELPHNLHTCSALEWLLIKSCPNLRSIPYPSSGQSLQGFTSLRQLEIVKCQELTNLPSEMMESCLQSLESLSLFGLRSLTNLPLLISVLQKMPRLTTLAISDVPKFNDVAAGIGSLHRLHILGIGPSWDSLDYVSFKLNFEGMLQVLRCLGHLSLFGVEHWDALPDQLQYLTALHSLNLRSFGIKVLPEWLGNLSSLKVLTFWSCKKLRRLPSKEAMHRLNKLILLRIFDCPLLKERCVEQQSDDSEWFKISHIPRIEVDGRQISVHVQ